MLKFLLPKEEDFFRLFSAISCELVQASKQFQLMLQDLDRRDQYAKVISLHEEKADQIANTALLKLHKTFITPFDRYDINQLINGLDDILDSINKAAKRIIIYQIQSIPEEIHAIATLCLQSTEIVEKAVACLNNLKNSKEILDLCLIVEDIESQTERVLLTGVSSLFQNENNYKHLLKIKEIYEYSKSIIKNCQGVSNIIKGVVLEYS
jgi:predicted phosphate transport protein (TIGR00153 family)